MPASNIPVEKSDEWHQKMLALEIASTALSGSFNDCRVDYVGKQITSLAEYLYTNYIEKLK